MDSHAAIVSHVNPVKLVNEMCSTHLTVLLSVFWKYTDCSLNKCVAFISSPQTSLLGWGELRSSGGFDPHLCTLEHKYVAELQGVRKIYSNPSVISAPQDSLPA